MRALALTLTAVAAFAAHARAEDFAEKLRQAQAQQASAPAPAPAPVAVPATPRKPKPTASVRAGSPRPAPTPAATTTTTAATPATATAAEGPSLTARLDSLEKFQRSLDRFSFEAFAHLRYDSQDAKKVRGLYARRVETKFKAKLWEQGSGVLGYDFAENKLKDLGLEIEGLPLWPGAEQKWKLRVGQFRQNFGIEPQQGSLKTFFAERAMVYGGAQPTTYTVKLVSERAMGLHALHQKTLGSYGYSVGLSLANNLSEDQAAGKNKISAADAFAKQTTDENPSLSTRLGLDATLGSFKTGLGASYARDNQNVSFLATKTSDQRYDEILGWDLSAEWPKRWKLQGEWVAANAIRGDLGLDVRREGWYLQQSLQPCRFFNPDAAQVEVLARYENTLPNVNQGARAIGAATGGLKWTYGEGNKQHLLLQYSAYALDGDFGAAAGTELWVLQQQLQF